MSSIAPLLPAGGSMTPEFLPAPSPRPAEQQHARSRRRHAAIAICSALVAMLMFAVLIFYGYVSWVIAHPYVAPLTSNPMEAKGLAYQDVSFPSASGRTTVHGWYIPAVADSSADDGVKLAGGSGSSSPVLLTSQTEADAISRTVIFSHGYGANREETWVPMYELANLLHRLDYNVLLFDYGYASSVDRSPATGGIEESQQLLAAIDYARAQGTDELIVWGFSMGGGTALQAALQTNQIDAMILDSLFVPTSEALYNNVRQFLDLPRFPTLPLMQWMLPLFTGVNFNHIPAEQMLDTAYSIPIFIMHGTDDVKAPVATAELIAATQNNALSRSWIVEGGKHELLFQTRPKEYISRAALFLSQVDAAYENEISLAQAMP
ncbi:pimeloyl-ACP methyl ester carboxylesterase [Paenibacillus phyllosphaerae]|uniref:Pimeloyl-ACP methyl ester carboxylesterase n=1 Tax=Paenibacillus phyllosphaerae TaxID=274593 RepID=A0A7W5B1D8_9BACL|nr:alpha/beta fold hydrolase [Paenibacillus phyllosphaerae]MBB3112612.1 pimeloyl-ACP methyl ester carboxylesterase [Paenibacillus phyllosphaerae]